MRSHDLNNGLRLSNTDKCRSVLVLLDNEWSKWTDPQIAKHCHVSHEMVNKLRKELEPKKKQVATVATPTTEANNDAGVNSKSPKKEAVEYAEYYPKQDEIKELAYTVSTLAAERGRWMLRYVPERFSAEAIF